MRPRKMGHHQVASGPEGDHLSEIQLEFLRTTESDAKPSRQPTPNDNETISLVASLHKADYDGRISDRKIVAGTGRFWVPLFLRRTTLLVFAISFIVLLAALTALWRVSERQLGLAVVDSKNYYIWTYGPTAVFTVASALWGQVEYRALQLFPWRLMSRGLVSASNSVLLDYISMWNVWALIKSLKRNHLAVSVAVTASLLIKLMTAFSTGLFTAKVVQMELSKEFQVQKVFDGISYNQSAMDAQVYLKMMGVKKYNLSNPAGTTVGHAFQNFFYDTSSSGTPVYLHNNTYTATVDVFTPSLECREASVTTQEDSTDVELRTDDCFMEIRGATTNQFHPMQGVLGSCDGDPSDIGIYEYEPRGRDVNADWRLWIYVSVWSEEGKGQPVLDNRYPNDIGYVDIIGLMCKLSYFTNRGKVTLKGTEDTRHPSVDLTIAHPVNISGLANISGSSILYGSYLSIARAAGSIGARRTDYLLLNTDIPGLEDIFDVHALIDRVTESVHALAVQLAAEYLTTPSVNTVTGSMKTEETRLTLRNAPVYTIISILGVLALLSLLFSISFLPYAVCPRDPGSIGGLATILANSHGFMAALSSTGQTSKAELRKILAGQVYTTTTSEDTFSIEQHGPVVNKPDRSLRLSWWRPFSAGPLARVLVLLVPVCLIVVLEILYQKSQRSNGIANVNTTLSLSYTWTYVPALVMLGVRTLFESVFFSARLFQPYHELKRGHASPEQSIMDNQHRKVAIAGVWDTLIKRQWPVMAAGVAVLIAPLLPIVVSGLYTVSDTVSASNITLVEMNRVNMSEGYFYIQARDDESVKVGDVILQYNLSYPQWTYQDLSFPKLKMDTGSLENETAKAPDRNGYFIDTRLPGLRLDLGCEELPKEAYVAGTYSDPEGDSHVFVNSTSLAKICTREAAHLESTQDVSSGNKYFNWFEVAGLGDLSDSPKSCPGLIVIYGKVGPTPSKLKETTVLQCKPKIEQVDVDVRLSLPSYAFDLTFPPSVVAESTKILFDGYMGSQDELVAPDDNDMVSAMLDLYPGDNSTADLDPIFRSIIHGGEGVSPDELLNPEILKAHLQKTWSTVTAQMINNRGREDYNETTTPFRERPTYSATLNNPFNTRLFQNMVSTRILQAILATMIICGAVSIFLMNTGEVLPKNPLSIAAMGSLLADSSILSSNGHAKQESIIPPGSEWCDDKQLKQRGVFQGRTFTLGWWPETSIEQNHSCDEACNCERFATSVHYNGTSELRKRFGIDAEVKLVP